MRSPINLWAALGAKVSTYAFTFIGSFDYDNVLNSASVNKPLLEDYSTQQALNKLGHFWSKWPDKNSY